MSTATTALSRNTLTRESPEAPPGHGLRDCTLVLATDGSLEAGAAARVAAALAHDCGAHPHALRALDVASWPTPDPMPDIVGMADALLGEQLQQRHAATLREELAGSSALACQWPLHVEMGTTARVITRTAEALHAALIVMGLRRHGPVDRIARDETTLHAIRGMPCPVLGTTPELDGLPHRVLVGMDFGRASVCAARAALDVVAPGGNLLLAYVQPPAVVPADDADGEGVVHALGVDAAFERVAAQLENDLDVRIEPVVLEWTVGENVSAVLSRCAQRVDAELIAVGSRRRHLIDRWKLGSVTRELAREGRLSLLAVPPHDLAARHR